MPRNYSMERRTTAVDETRQRIVEATIVLHMEKGVQATSMQDIAARASVSLGTVYRHFPTIDDLLPACTGHTLDLHPAPTSAAFTSLDGLDRIVALISAIYHHYEAIERAYVVGYAESPQFPVLRQFMAEIDAHRRNLVEEALAPLDAPTGVVELAVALADFHTWYAFHRNGLTMETATACVCETLSTHVGQVRSRGMK